MEPDRPFRPVDTFDKDLDFGVRRQQFVDRRVEPLDGTQNACGVFREHGGIGVGVQCRPDRSQGQVGGPADSRQNERR